MIKSTKQIHLLKYLINLEYIREYIPLHLSTLPIKVKKYTIITRMIYVILSSSVKGCDYF